MALAREQPKGDLSIHGMVFREQDAQWGDRSYGGLDVRRERSVRALERHRNHENRACARLALDADFAAHRLDDAAADGEPEPGAAEAARGAGVHLRELVEQLD